MLTRRGFSVVAAGLALYAAGAALGYVELVVLGAGALLAVVAGFGWMLRRPAIEVHRSIEPDRVARGDEAWGVVTFTNAGRMASSSVTAVERWGAERLPVATPRLPAGGSASVRYRLPTGRRTAVDVGPLDLTREDPLALWRTVRTAGDVRRLWVHPVARPLVGLPPGRTRSLDAGGRDRIPAGTTTFHALREYVPGDDFRLIHWRSYARTGQLLVRENVDPTLPRTLLVVDDRAGVHEGDGFEEAMDVAASVVLAATAAGYPLRMVAVGGRAVETLGTPRHGPLGQAHTFLDALAELAPTAGADDMRQLAASLALEHRGDTLVVVTGTPDTSDLAALGALARRYDDTVVVLVGEGAPHAPVPAGAAQVVRGVTAVDVADVWNRRLR